MMRGYTQRITIVTVRRQRHASLNEQLQWLGQTLGLFNPRDKDASCFRIFIELLKAAKHHAPMSSDDIAYRLQLSRGTVVHHINKLIEAGLVINEGNRYLLRVDNLEELIDELRHDAERTFRTLKDVAQNLDQSLGL